MNLRLALNPSNRAGFTLLEVLIAFFLLSFISLAIYQATTESFKLREILLNDGDFFNSIRMAMGILEKDVAMMYSPTLIIPEKDSSQQGQQPPVIPDTHKKENSIFWTKVVDPTGIRAGHFVGTEKKLTFISASHLRVYKDSAESVFSKIIYELRNADPKDDTYKGTSVLFKIENSNAFDVESDDDKSQRIYPLVSGIQKFQYRYYRKSKDQWYGKWDSDSDDFKNSFPDIIEVNIQVVGPSRLQFDGQFKFRPEIPINGLSPST